MTPSAMPEPKKGFIPLSWIQENYDTQVRGQVSAARVASLEQVLQEAGGELDPIELMCESGEPSAEAEFFCCDGFHRIAAYRGCGKTKIPALIHKGTKSDAIELGIRRNARHGTPMTAKEKRHATEIAVNDARLGELPDKKIARMIGVSPSLVSEVRRGVSAASATAKRRQRTAPAPARAESESAAPRPATARERKDTTADRPTKKQILKQIENWLTLDMIEDDDLIELCAGPNGRYVFLPKDGEAINLRVVGASGRIQVAVPVTVKEISYQNIDLRYTAGKLREE